MKIIQVIPHLSLGGAENMCESLVYELKALGHEVIVISLYRKETAITQRLQAEGIDLRYLDKKLGLDFSMFKKLASVFKAEKPDIIHTHLAVTKYVFPVAARQKIKVVHTIHSVATKELPKAERWLNRFFYKKHKAIPVALSNQIQKTALDEYRLPSNHIPVILNGVNLSKCRPKQCYTVNGSFKILHVGRFEEVKNHSGMIDAFEIFHAKHPDSELHFVGDGTKRPLITQVVQEKNLSNAVVFHGLQANVHEFLSRADIFTLPSLYEGIPLSIAEAMGTGLPIVATAVGGIPDMLDDKSALLVPVDTEKIATAFEKYYEEEELRKRHGLAALARSKQFSSEIMAEKYIEIYSGSN